MVFLQMDRAWLYHNKPKKRWVIQKVIKNLKESRSFYTEQDALDWLEELRQMYPGLAGKQPGYQQKGYDRSKKNQRMYNKDAELLSDPPRGVTPQDEGSQSPETRTTPPTLS